MFIPSFNLFCYFVVVVPSIESQIHSEDDETDEEALKNMNSSNIKIGTRKRIKFRKFLSNGPSIVATVDTRAYRCMN